MTSLPHHGRRGSHLATLHQLAIRLSTLPQTAGAHERVPADQGQPAWQYLPMATTTHYHPYQYYRGAGFQTESRRGAVLFSIRPPRYTVTSTLCLVSLPIHRLVSAAERLLMREACASVRRRRLN